MLSQSVSIPDCSATHIIGDTALDIGHGDLVLAAASPRKETGPGPVLMLSIGKAAFPLYQNTVFGTVSGDERVYVFKPDLGTNSVTGYVFIHQTLSYCPLMLRDRFIRMTLPDGIKQEDSELRRRQKQFEEILVANDLLKAGEDAPAQAAQSVTIPAVSAFHVMDGKSIEIARGTLILARASRDVLSPSEGNADVVLTLSVGGRVFILRRTTLFGTLADDERSYVFQPEEKNLPEGQKKGYVSSAHPRPLAR